MQIPPSSIQSNFLEQIKKSLPKNISLADELAEQLNISRDSAYRRIRGETILSLDEISTLAGHFKVSVDSFLSTAPDLVTFQLKATNRKEFTFEKWMSSILENLDLIGSFPDDEKELIHDSKDLSVFHYFQFPRLSAFKLYFWMKSFSDELKNVSGKYDQTKVPRHMLAMGEKIWERYSKITSTEIIRAEMITVTLRQIEYLYDSGLFMDTQDAMNLCDDCIALTNHLQHQAQLGIKATYGSGDGGAKLTLYVNDLLIGSNTILFKLGDKRITYFTPNNFDLLMTTHTGFCQFTEDHMQNLIEHSVLISMTAEKERNKFFNMICKSALDLKARIL